MKRSSLLPPLSSRSSSLQLHKDKQASEHNFCLCSGKFFRNKAATWRRAVRAGKKRKRREGGTMNAASKFREWESFFLEKTGFRGLQIPSPFLTTAKPPKYRHDRTMREMCVESLSASNIVTQRPKELALSSRVASGVGRS